MAESRHDAQREYAERRLQSWALERRRQDRQVEEFREELFRIRVTNGDDGATAAVFHGMRQQSRRERMLQEHREQIAAELRKKVNRHAIEIRRGTGEIVFCRHCGRQVRGLAQNRKCNQCKADPALVTARGTETRSFVPRREAQPSITPLSADAARVEEIVAELPQRDRDVIERRHLLRQSDSKAAEELGISVRVFAGLVSGAIAAIAASLANGERSPV